MKNKIEITFPPMDPGKYKYELIIDGEPVMQGELNMVKGKPMKLLYPYWLREAWRYHQDGHQSLWGARVELDIARRKLCREIQRGINNLLTYLDRYL